MVIAGASVALVAALLLAAYCGAWLVAEVSIRDILEIWRGEPRPTVHRARMRAWELLWARRGYEWAQRDLARARAQLIAQADELAELEHEIAYLHNLGGAVVSARGEAEQERAIKRLGAVPGVAERASERVSLARVIPFGSGGGR